MNDKLKISGPIKVSVIESETSFDRELHIAFTEEFKELAAAERKRQFHQYIESLQQHLTKPTDDDAEKQGVITILQFCEQLLPFIETDEIDLDQPIEAQIQSPIKISNFIDAGSTH